MLSVGLLTLQEILGIVKSLLGERLAGSGLGCVVRLLQAVNLVLQAGNALAGVVDLLLGTSDLELELLDLVLVTALLVLELVDLLVDLGDLLLVVRSGGGVVNDLLVLGEIGTGLILLALQIGNLALGVGDGLLEVLDLLGLGVDLILRSVLGLGGVKLLVEILEIILQALDVGLGVFGLLLGVRLLGVETLALVLPLVELGRVEVNGLLLLLGVGLGVLEFLRLALANLEVGVEPALGLLTSDVEALNGLVGIGNDVLGFLEFGDVLVMVLGESIDLVVDVSEVGLELGDVLVSGGIVKSILGVGEGRLLLVDDLLGGLDLVLVSLVVLLELGQVVLGGLEIGLGLVDSCLSLGAADLGVVLLVDVVPCLGWGGENLGTAPHDSEGGQSAGEAPVHIGHGRCLLVLAGLRRIAIAFVSILARVPSRG